MKVVITYGTFDHFHEGHKKLLEHAKALGDYLIVGVTSDLFDFSRGKINVEQNVTERISGVLSAGIADKIIVEEYVGQKIDDIKKYGVNVFAIGSDWDGKFDYLREFCDVVYLPRTPGISSSMIRSSEKNISIGIIGSGLPVSKFINESHYVNGVSISGVYSNQNNNYYGVLNYSNLNDMLNECDAIYVMSPPQQHYSQIKLALSNGKHVICESPIAMCAKDWDELQELAKKKGLILMDMIKTAYSTAYQRMLLLLKTGAIGHVTSLEATSTSLSQYKRNNQEFQWPSICYWGINEIMAVFQIFGIDSLKSIQFYSKICDFDSTLDVFTKMNFVGNDWIASMLEGNGIKSEGDMVVSGTLGYIYIPSPWWKMDYFEIRYEDSSQNKKVFYQLEGEGIRNAILAFANSIQMKKDLTRIDKVISRELVRVIELYYQRKNVIVF